MLVVAAGASSPELVPDLPVRPLCRQLVDVGPVDGLPADLPMVVEEESGFHFRRRGETRSGSRCPSRRRAGAPTRSSTTRSSRTSAAGSRTAIRRGAGAAVVRAWAGLYDMTPDAHPIIGWVGDGVYAACGFSGHGFMQSPAVGRAVAEELLGRSPSVDLSPYRLERFSGDATFPETLVL